MGTNFNYPGGGYRPLGNTGICCSPIGYGCASVFGKKLISDEEAEDLFLTAYNNGIRFFDTGHSYGNAEERIGIILKKHPEIKREEIIISTKFGTRYINGKAVHDVSPEWIEKSVQTSLKRMNLSYIDCLQVHGPNREDLTDIFFTKLQELKSRGLVKAIGANTFDSKLLEYIGKTKCFDFVMLDYNILRRDREPIIHELYGNGIGVIGGAALAESLFSNRIFKIRKLKDVWYLARAVVKFRGQLFYGRKYQFVNRVEGITGNQVALKYVLDNPEVTTVVFGSANCDHLAENIQALDKVIPQETVDRIKDIPVKKFS